MWSCCITLEDKGNVFLNLERRKIKQNQHCGKGSPCKYWYANMPKSFTFHFWLYSPEFIYFTIGRFLFRDCKPRGVGRRAERKRKETKWQGFITSQALLILPPQSNMLPVKRFSYGHWEYPQISNIIIIILML